MSEYKKKIALVFYDGERHEITMINGYKSYNWRKLEDVYLMHKYYTLIYNKYDINVAKLSKNY